MGLLKDTKLGHVAKGIAVAMIVGLALMMTACHDETTSRKYKIRATIERLSGSIPSKTYLVDERWVYWQEYDIITIGSDRSTRQPPTIGILYNTYAGIDFEDYNGVFDAELEDGSQYFVGLFPHSESNVILGNAGSTTFKEVKIDLPAEQPYTSDITFARNVFPMVAWYGGVWDENDEWNLDFHSLGGIVRLQFYNASTQDETIKNITITSLDNRQLTGLFDVVDYKHYETVHVEGTGVNADNNKIAIGCGDGIGFKCDSLLTFYVVMPATSGRDSIRHHLQVDIENNNGQHCTKSFYVSTRRNGISYMQALGVKSFDEGTAERGLVGNGTPERPFKIYQYDDLVLIKEAFDAVIGTTNKPKINGQTVDTGTYFQLMHSSITLPNDTWTGGIKGFVGHMSNYIANVDRPNIINNSRYPLFESIEEDGIVDGIVMSRNINNSITTSSNISLFCTTNNGTISNCRFTTGDYPLTTSSTGGTQYAIAGLCLTNNGTISGSGCTAKMDCSQGLVSGICYDNYGSIEQCYVSTPMTVSNAATASGICHNNRGTVRECYFAARISTRSNTPWAGIVFNNYQNSLVERCYASSTALLLSNSSIGGIVNNQMGGVIDKCWAAAQLDGSVVGGIVGTMTSGMSAVVSIRNCFVDKADMAITASVSGGGLVGETAGSGGATPTIENSFVYMAHMSTSSTTATTGGLVGKIVSPIVVKNCYSYETSTSLRKIYGSSAMDASDYTDWSKCYLVGGASSGDGYSTISTSGTTADINSNLNDMQDNLNTDPEAEWIAWTGASATETTSIKHPHLNISQQDAAL